MNERIPCNLKADVLHGFNEMSSPLAVFQKVMQLDKLVTLTVTETNRYAQQNGRNFVTNAAEMKAFLGMNYIMGVNKLPTTHHYWESDDYVGNEGFRNVMTRGRFKEILQNIHLADNSKSNKEPDKGCKIRSLIDHFNKVFPEAMSDDSEQTIDEHMVKFKGRSSMKQYVKSKPIKWEFKFWFRCASKTGYLQEMDMYLGKEEQVEHSLDERVVFQLSQKLNDTYCTLFFDNFFNSTSLVETLYQRGIYGIGTVRKDRKHMPSMVPGEAMKRGDHEFQYSDKAISCK